MTSVADNLRRVLDRVENARQHVSQAVSLVAVSKRQPDELIQQAIDFGVRDFGENYVQELVRRQAMHPDVRWHMIGHLQTNKAKLATVADVVHTIDSEKAARALAKYRTADNPQSIFLQVNTSGETTKSGVQPDDVEPLIESIQSIAEVRVIGLMCLPSRENAREEFAGLRQLRDKLESKVGCKLPELSMGTSGDFEDAILEGSTMIRVGTGVFGERPTPPAKQ